jgi:hypothetical protein
MNSADLPQIIGGIALLVGTVFTGIAGLSTARDRMSKRERKRLDQLEDWRVIARRVIAELRGILSDHRIAEPEDLDELLKFPPEEATTDDDPV